MYGPPEIAKRYSKAGAAKTKLPLSKMLILSFFAGAFIAFGAFGSQVASADAGTAASVGKLMGALVFPVGLLMVIMAGAELFTGNNLIIISVLDRKATLAGMLRNWVVVYMGNFLGSVFVAAMLTFSHAYSAFGGAVAQTAVATAQTKVTLTFPDAFLRGILCNILVCIAVWVSFSAEDVAGKIIGLFMPILLFVVSGYEHCVANMYFIPAGMFVSAEYGIDANITWSGFLLGNLLPVTLGNMIGGVGIVGLGYFFSYLYNTAEEPKPAPAPEQIAPAPILERDQKPLNNFTEPQQDMTMLGLISEDRASLPNPLPMTSPEIHKEEDYHTIEVTLNGSMVRIQNDADSALLRQTLRLLRGL